MASDALNLRTAAAALPLSHCEGDIRAVASRYAAQLQLCRTHTPASYYLARNIHNNIITSGFKPRPHIINRMIDIYCKSSNLVYAQRLFDEIPQPDVVARTTLVAAYYAAGNTKLAGKLFDRIPYRIRDTVCYNAMITGYSHNEDGHSAVKLFNDMRRKGFRPDEFTYTSALGGLALIAELQEHCQQLHCLVLKTGNGLITSVANALISLYVKCASSPLLSSSVMMDSARKLFDEMSVRDEFNLDYNYYRVCKKCQS